MSSWIFNVCAFHGNQPSLRESLSSFERACLWSSLSGSPFSHFTQVVHMGVPPADESNAVASVIAGISIVSCSSQNRSKIKRYSPLWAYFHIMPSASSFCFRSSMRLPRFRASCWVLTHLPSLKPDSVLYLAGIFRLPCSL